MGTPFHDMKEVYLEADRIRESDMAQDDKDMLLFVLGCLPNQGISSNVLIDGKDVPIDSSIVQIIASLNKQGFPTLACCSGLDCDHKDVRPILKPSSGYLCFADTAPNRAKLKSMPPIPGVTVEWDTKCFLQPAISVHFEKYEDALLMERWDALYHWFTGKNLRQVEPYITAWDYHSSVTIQIFSPLL